MKFTTQLIPEGYKLYTGPSDWAFIPGAKFWNRAISDWGQVEKMGVPGANAEPGIDTIVPIEPEPELRLPPPPPDVLEEALALTNGDRADDYGDARESFARIAALWSPVFGVEVTPKQVALCMVLLKVSRACTSDKRDTWVDMAGYARLGHIVSKP